MNHVYYFEDLFESISDCRKTLLLLFLIKNDVDSINECGYLKIDFNHVCLEFKKTSTEQNEAYSDFIENEEESIVEMILNKQMESYLSTMFEVVRHERSLIVIPSYTDLDVLKQSKFTDHRINIIKNLALEKLYRQRKLKEYVAV